jgi:hypothetical protein
MRQQALGWNLAANLECVQLILLFVILLFIGIKVFISSTADAFRQPLMNAKKMKI